MIKNNNGCFTLSKANLRSTIFVTSLSSSEIISKSFSIGKSIQPAYKFVASFLENPFKPVTIDMLDRCQLFGLKIGLKNKSSLHNAPNHIQVLLDIYNHPVEIYQ